MKIVVGCDESALIMKNSIKEMLIKKGHEVLDCGVFDEKPSLYPDVAFEVAELISKGNYERGMLFSHRDLDGLPHPDPSYQSGWRGSDPL